MAASSVPTTRALDRFMVGAAGPKMRRMTFDAAFDRLHALCREAHLIRTAADVLAWDREVMMPPAGIEARAAVMELLARLEHERSTAPAFEEALADCEAAADVSADDPRNADLRELRFRRDRAARLPAALVGELARVESRAQHAWEDARAASDFARFAPWLDQLLDLVRQKAACLGHGTGGEPFDALVEDYEPGTSARALAALLEPLAERQSALVRAHLGRAGGAADDDAFRRATVPEGRQAELCRAIAERLGFDFARGRLDPSVHPFTSGTHPDDVRLTTRYSEHDLFDGLYSTIHEAGHGLYEQGLPADRAGLPTGSAASLAVHESQSRFFENHVGRSLGFWQQVFPTVRAICGEPIARFTPQDALRAARRVRPSLIRVDADEATYDLHVVVRFRIERELLGGDLDVADLPARWNALYRELLGVAVPDDRHGCLQDVHWSAGMFGYFPTYTLGNLYAAQLAEAATSQLGDLDELLAAGEFAQLLGWLRENVHRHGGRWRAPQLVERVSGRPPSVEPFLRHLERRLLG